MNENTQSKNSPNIQDPAAQSAQTQTNGVHIESATTPNETQTKVAQLEAALTEEKNRYLYLAAEFENFRKRNQSERVQLLRFGGENIARDMIQTLDNLERAAEHRNPESFKSLLEGIDLVLKQFQTALGNHGVRPVDSIGKLFDPHLHEAMGQEISKEPEGTIIKEHAKGYLFHDRLLRPARVVLSRPS